MSAGARAALFFAAGLAATAALPFAARALRGPPGPRCASDGVPLAGAPVVRVTGEGGAESAFCCVGCAEAWLRATPGAPARVTVTDAATGAEVDAGSAWFVRSSVVAQPATGDRIHAFAKKEDAIQHAESYRGTVLSGKESPFEGKVTQRKAGD